MTSARYFFFMSCEASKVMISDHKTNYLVVDLDEPLDYIPLA
jgi:hypothetical protein